MNTILHHKDIEPFLARLLDEPEFKCGSTDVNLPQYYKPTGKEWYRASVTLEFPTGELATGLLNRWALVGPRNPEAIPIVGTERFNANGLEGKCAVQMDFFGALIKMRDLLPPWRGRIILG